MRALRLVPLAALLAALACGARPEPAARSLVLVSLDTLRADHLGLHGYARATSPQLDRWSEHAFVFLNAVAPANATTASHHALFQSRSAGVALAERDGAATLAQLLRERGLRTAAFTGGGTLSRQTGFARGFELWDEDVPALTQSVPRALAFLDQAAASRERFYLFVHAFDVHLPYDPPPPYDRAFLPDYRGPVRGANSLPLLRAVRRIFEQAHQPEAPRLDADDRAQVAALYDGEIAHADAVLARLLARLEQPDLAGTLVVILSDHGEEFWEHGSVLHAHTLYQEQLHVPLLLRVPGREREARRIEARVSLLDVLPTALELLGVPAPASARGRSLLPLMRGDGAAAPARPAFAEGFAFDAKLQAVLDGDWKLIRDLGSGRLALYDLGSDPREQHDVAQSRPAEALRLRALLDAELGAQLPAADPLPLPARPDPATEDRLRALGYVD